MNIIFCTLSTKIGQPCESWEMKRNKDNFKGKQIKMEINYLKTYNYYVC